MKVVKTNEYPTRHEAFKNHGIIFENNKPVHRGGFEYLYYYNGNTPYNYCSVNICSFQGTEYLVEAEASHKTKEKGYAKCFDTYNEAKRVALRKVKQFDAWLLKQE